MPYRRLDSPYWWVCANGVRKSSGTTDRKEAEALEAKLNHDYWLRRNFPEQYLREVSRTWDEACLEWFKANNHLKSVRQNAFACEYWNQYLRGMMLSQIDREIVIQAVSKRPGVKAGERTPQNTTANALIFFVVKILTFANKVLHSPKTPWFYGPVPTIQLFPTPGARERYLTVEEWRRLSTAAGQIDEDLRDIITLGVTTGLRQGNILALSPEDLGDRSVILPGSMMKSGKPLGAPLAVAAWAVIQGRQEKDGRLFTYRGKPVTDFAGGIYKAFSKAKRAAEIEGLVFHGLRHTWNTWLASEGVSREIRSRLGGWATGGQAIDGYTHLDVEPLRPYAERIDKLLTFDSRQHQETVVTH